MCDFWVIDTKCKVLLESTIPQDGSFYYYGRSVVPASSKESAVEQLITVLKEHDILVEAVLAAVLYKDGQWQDDDDFEVQISFSECRLTNKIEIGCLVSEKSFQRR